MIDDALPVVFAEATSGVLTDTASALRCYWSNCRRCNDPDADISTTGAQLGKQIAIVRNTPHLSLRTRLGKQAAFAAEGTGHHRSRLHPVPVNLP